MSNEINTRNVPINMAAGLVGTLVINACQFLRGLNPVAAATSYAVAKMIEDSNFFKTDTAGKKFIASSITFMAGIATYGALTHVAPVAAVAISAVILLAAIGQNSR